MKESSRCSKRRKKKKNRVTKDRGFVIAIIASIVRILAFQRAGELAEVRNAVESFKSGVSATVDDLKEIRSQIGEKGTQNVAELKTKLQLVEANGYILI